MNGINKVILVGTITKDPDVKQTSNGSDMANFSLATNESWVDKKTSEKKETTEYHNVVVYGSAAKVCGKIGKGSKLYVEGKLQTRKYQDKNTGQDKYITEIVLSGYNSQLDIIIWKEREDFNQDNNFKDDLPPVQVADNTGFADDIPF
jgi:single-strand DNA-binding protein